MKGDLNPEPYGLITNKVCPLCGYPLQKRYKKGIGTPLWICTNEPEVCGFLSNNLAGGKMAIQKCTECLDGYLIVKTKNEHPFLGCTNYKTDGLGCNNTLSQKDYDDNLDKDEIIKFEDFNRVDENLETKNSEKSTPNQTIATIETNDNDEKSEEKDLRYFTDKKLNNLAMSLRKFAEDVSKQEGIVF